MQVFNRCRICLKYRKKLKLIWEQETTITLAEMITLVSGIKIPNDRQIDKICQMCRRKLKDSYEFMLLIKRSNMALQQMAHIKRICFNNISDVKFDFNFTQDDQKDSLAPFHILYSKGDSMITYKKTIIKKKCENKYDNESKHAITSDVLDTIKSEYCNGDDNVYDDIKCNADDLSEVNSKEQKRKKRFEFKDEGSKHLKPIKPVFLRDIRVIPQKRKINKYKPCIKKEMCPYCGKMCTSIHIHILTHTGKRSFKCDTCAKGFYTKGNLKTHLKTHSPIKNFRCHECVARFSNKEALKSHTLSHKEERNFTCDICQKAFKRKSTLSRHVMTHSFSCKTVKCELCTMSFVTKDGLKHHMRVHTGERPYMCEICSQPYSYKHDFNRHCFKKHGVFLKRRSVYVMNEEVLKQEHSLMRDLMLRTHGIVDDDKGLNPFEGPQAALAFEQTLKAIKDNKIHIISHQL